MGQLYPCPFWLQQGRAESPSAADAHSELATGRWEPRSPGVLLQLSWPRELQGWLSAGLGFSGICFLEKILPQETARVGFSELP